MNPKSNTSKEKIAEALDLINEAAKDKKDEIREMMSEKYHGLKEVLLGSEIKHSFDSAKKSAAEAAAKAKDIGEEKVKEFATQVDQNVHSSPWQFIGGAALFSLLLGYILGRKN